MNNSIPSRWPDLANISVRHASLLSGIQRCTILYRSREAVHLLLLPVGIFSVIGHDEELAAQDGVAEAVGRVVAAHPRADANDPRPAQPVPRGGNEDSYGWPDLPGVWVGVRSGVENQICCTISSETGTAKIVIASDPVISAAATALTSKERGILIAIGRLMLAHGEAGRVVRQLAHHK